MSQAQAAILVERIGELRAELQRRRFAGLLEPDLLRLHDAVLAAVGEYSGACTAEVADALAESARLLDQLRQMEEIRESFISLTAAQRANGTN